MLKKSTMLSLAFLLTILGFSFLFSTSSQAAGTSDIAISPVYPSNQISKNGIFDLKVEPGQTQTVSMKIANLSKEAKTLKITATTAYTSDGGVLAIDRDTIPKSETLKYKFQDLVAKDDRTKTVEIPANQILEVPFKLNIPQNKFDGLIVGGLLVQTDNTANPINNKGVSVKNKFAYAMSVVLKEQDQTAEPSLKLGTIKAGKVGSSIKVKTEFKNTAPAIVSDMSVDSVITKKDSNTIMGKTTQNGMSMAPNSQFSFANNWNKKNILPGNYHYKATVQTADGHHWLLEKDFKISIADAVLLNDHYNPWIKYIVLAIILIILALIVWYIVKKRKQNKKEVTE